MIYGNPKARLVSYSRDRTGAATLNVSKPWTPSKTGLSINELIDEMPDSESITNYFVNKWGLTLDNGLLRSTWEYLGVSGWIDGVPNLAEDSECEFEPEWGERSLLLHPDWYAIQKKYGGYVDEGTGRIIWPQWMPEGGYNTSSSSSSDWILNKMFGRQTYPDLTGGTWSCAYATSRKADVVSAYERIGEIFEHGEVPGDPPDFSERNWLKMAPGYKKIKGCMRLGQRYRLSDVGGWMEDIHSKWTKQET